MNCSVMGIEQGPGKSLLQFHPLLICHRAHKEQTKIAQNAIVLQPHKKVEFFSLQTFPASNVQNSK